MMKIFRMVSSITITIPMCASCPADDDMQPPGTCDDIPSVPGSWSPLGCRLRWSPASTDADTKVASRVLQFCHRCTSIFTIFSTYYRLLLSLRCVFNHDFHFKLQYLPAIPSPMGGLMRWAKHLSIWYKISKSKLYNSCGNSHSIPNLTFVNKDHISFHVHWMLWRLCGVGAVLTMVTREMCASCWAWNEGYPNVREDFTIT